MHPTPHETLASVCALLRNSVLTTIEDEFGRSMVETCIGALERLDRRTATEVERMKAHVAWVASVLDAAGSFKVDDLAAEFRDLVATSPTNDDPYERAAETYRAARSVMTRLIERTAVSTHPAAREIFARIGNDLAAAAPSNQYGMVLAGRAVEQEYNS